MFVTHDLDEAIYLSDRIVVLAANPGRVKVVINVPIVRPRETLSALRVDPVFQTIRAEAWAMIRTAGAKT